MDGPRFDGQASAVRHGLKRIEGEIQEHLAQLRPVGSHPGQAVGQARFQLDFLLRGFSADEYAQVVDELVDVGGLELRLGVAGEGEHLLHDGIQVVHFFAHNPHVLGARVVRRELQAKRVVQHLEDGQRVADLVGHLAGQQAKRGEFLVLPQQLLRLDDALEQARLLDGDGGQLGQRHGDLDFVVGEHVGLGLVDVQRADGASPENERHAQQGDEPLVARHVRLLIGIGGLDVLDLQRLHAVHHRAEKTFRHDDVRLVEVGLPRAVRGDEGEPVAALVEQLQRAGSGAHQAARLAGDGGEGVVEIHGRVDRLADGDE